ncbi:hypothetical protein [Oscillatoria sp. FACHB-1406]|uniref:hypothetical protein n=1 Tax=Oscillatoria sp. FACHB-1406 TaxID=2692846 RepID=UPI0016859FC0|nr:hypothetical protein [Oscillatoria sp. FACHB-1406]MBD2580122.1 hypothetical protein [Oscillatoria sp. FACHB-1406]
MSLDLGDPRAITQPVYEALNGLRSAYNVARDKGQIKAEDYQKRLREQKSQTQELYTFLATWGLMRLRAEEMSRNDWEKPPAEIPLFQRAKKNQEGKREAISCFFECLEKVAKVNNLASEKGIETLNQLKSEDYIGLTGIALAVAKEFSFWADAIYPDIKGGESE